MMGSGRSGIYKRKEDIHGKYGGQSQGGISTPKGEPFVLIFTSDVGESFGYQDQFRPDGMFWYTGEGQIGDMEMVRGNLAIRDYIENDKQLHLFEYTKKAYVSYLGGVKCVGHHIEERPDREGNLRKAIIFHLALQPEHALVVSEPLLQYGDETKPVPKLSLDQLRQLALQTPTANATKTQIIQNVIFRSEAVRLYALKRSEGKCEGCQKPSPFVGKDGPFLEVHHVLRLGDGGPDHPAFVIALCPNCHRKVHYGLDGAKYNKQMIAQLSKLEFYNLCLQFYD
jgi:5-methylcytosine-specific restriction protein A